MIEVGESSGALAPMLTSVAEFYEDEVALRLAALVSIIEPAILVFMGALVAFILVSLYLPIFSFSASGVAGLRIISTPETLTSKTGVTPAPHEEPGRESSCELSRRHRHPLISPRP